MTQELKIKKSRCRPSSSEQSLQAPVDLDIGGATMVCSSVIVASLPEGGRSARPCGERDREVVG